MHFNFNPNSNRITIMLDKHLITYNIKLTTKTMSSLFSSICSFQVYDQRFSAETFSPFLQPPGSVTGLKTIRYASAWGNIYRCSNHITNQLAMLASELEDKHSQKAQPSFCVLRPNSLASSVTMREHRCARPHIGNQRRTNTTRQKNCMKHEITPWRRGPLQ
jgi:hypothetical protein